ncbi:MAG: sugar ABC transporter permease [Bacilli bacterium]|jgi:multiple sugar transport system permease protein|nr:sugar ABC transporter permease [Bacilli bacterium]MCH4235438.1 sugar ABC transporter permease [Bacilli bacterium]
MKRNASMMSIAHERRKQTIKKGLGISVFLGPYLISFIMFFLFPFIFGIIISLSKFDGTSFMPSGFNGLNNFIMIFTNRVLVKDFWGSVWTTIKFALIIVPLSILIPFGLAMLIKVHPPGYKFFRAAIYVPGIFPLTATGLILLKMFSFQNGFINNFFNISVDWFGETNLAWFMVGLFCIWGGIGGNFIILNAGLENIDNSLYEASQVDGSNKWQQFRYITLPGVRYQLLLTLFTTFIGYMNLYGQLFILASNTPDQNAMKSAIYRIQDLLMGSSRSFGYASAMGICLGAIIGFIAVLQMIMTKDRKGGNKHVKAYLDWQKQK